MNKNINGYIPSPKFCNVSELPAGITGIVEKLAENIHEVWAKQKMDEGWTYGEALNWDTKRHPSLKPYADLPESQKTYDRNTALATLGFIMDEGYHIVIR
ncbi:MAG: Ryanodine receptor Ryr [Bacteroidales bacterium]|nr:Ryanodine receptor Ryr [Bacteroidales bacterium]